MMINETLKPCPFCGGKAEIRQVTSTSAIRNIFVVCMNCFTTSDNYPSMEKAAEAWNRRTS